MRYTLLRLNEVVASKEHRCIWCGEPINQNEKHVNQVGTYEGELQNDRYHMNCYGASRKWFSTELEFDPYSFKRGTLEER